MATIAAGEAIHEECQCARNDLSFGLVPRRYVIEPGFSAVIGSGKADGPKPHGPAWGHHSQGETSAHASLRRTRHGKGQICTSRAAGVGPIHANGLADRLIAIENQASGKLAATTIRSREFRRNAAARKTLCTGKSDVEAVGFLQQSPDNSCGVLQTRFVI